MKSNELAEIARSECGLWGASRVSRPDVVDAQKKITAFFAEGVSRMMNPELWRRLDAISRIKAQPFWR